MTIIRCMAVALVLMAAQFAFGHARLVDPAPRNTGSGIKNGPCGNVDRTTNPKTLVAGSQITVRWEETINHPGRYYISFSPANDQGFEQNRLATVVDTQNAAIGTGPNHQYSTVITVPNTPCENCTLQMIQSMEENPQAPTFYYSCADIRIVAEMPATPTPVRDNSGGSNSAQNSGPSVSVESVKVGAACGSVGKGGPGSGSFGPILLLMFIPGLCYGLLVRFARRQTSIGHI